MPKSTDLSKYESSKMVDIIKKTKLMNLNNKAIINAIQFHTGKTINESQLERLVEIAKKEVREQQIEVDKHMEHMVKMGLYVDTMNNYEQLNTVQQILFSMILEEEVKPPEEKSVNKILAMSSTLKNIITGKDSLVTNIGFLAKIKNVYENTQAIESEANTGGGGGGGVDKPSPIELKKSVNVMIKDQKTDVNKLIDEAIDQKELENNRVA